MLAQEVILIYLGMKGDIMPEYQNYIMQILNTRGRFGCGEEYHERHHIVPRCMGGADTEDNLIIWRYASEIEGGDAYAVRS